MLVSIIIPVHKTIDFFKSCIDSVLSQSYHNLEVIVACNGELEIDRCKEFVNISDSRIIYIKTQNGRHNARNEALLISKGKYIQFLDYDDLLFLNKIETQVSLLEEIKITNIVSITKWKKFNSNINANYNFPFDEMFDKKNITTGMLIEKLGKSGGFIATSSWIVPRDLIKELKWVDSPNDDAIFFSEICKKEPNVIMISEILAGCRVHDDNTSAIRSKKQFDLLLKGWNSIYDNLKMIKNSNVNLYMYKSYLYLIGYSRSINRHRFWEVICKSIIFGIKSRIGFYIFSDIKKKIFN